MTAVLLLLATPAAEARGLVRDALRDFAQTEIYAFTLTAEGYAQSGTWDGLTRRNWTRLDGQPPLWANGNRVAGQWDGRWQEIVEAAHSVQGMDNVHRYEQYLLGRPASEFVAQWSNASHTLGEDEELDGVACRVIDSVAEGRALQADLATSADRAYTRLFAPVNSALDPRASTSTYRAWVATEGGRLLRLEWTLDAALRSGQEPQLPGADAQTYFDQHVDIRFRAAEGGATVEAPGEVRRVLGN